VNDAFLCDGIRTPIGKFGGALASVRPDDLLAHVLRALVARNPGVDWAAIDDSFFGNANGAGEDNRNVGRMAVLLAGLPDRTPANTVNRLCGSGLDAIALAARTIRAGDAVRHAESVERLFSREHGLRHDDRLAFHQPGDEGGVRRRQHAGDG